MESAGPSMNMQAEVNGVHVNFVGLRRISYKCVEKEVEGIKNAKRLDRAFEEIHRSVTRLKALGVFTDFSAHLTGGVGPNSMGVNMIFEEKLPKREFSIRIDESGRPGIEGSFSQPAFLGNLQGLELSAGAMGRQDTELQILNRKEGETAALLCLLRQNGKEEEDMALLRVQP
uniref:Uncharacterized protein n=1 Tax=Chromera velia CCMP2878 TaxID=1169474 RepID=A0A0G4HR85_9ALVE|eukprot:Cvel_30470.t1-p1 / transcript=Cvel_30470.t1 / gene=Cvel_30470 / organism=Chromera_velia_CCMP2878 / gene_product=hypothetical protein / transcript_product=hypothetical protein / location=Cvel_scaffold4349:3683-7207(+) / protein_length=172 / sequence_SO=supercontig / SO=protein_coding / is_pseudo=false